MISKIRAVAIAAATFAFAGATLIGGPVQAWEGGVAVPTMS
jgi:hypothetical protein